MEKQVCGAVGEEQGADLGDLFAAVWSDDERDHQALGNGWTSRVWSASIPGR